MISVWHRDNRNENIRFGVGEKMKEILELEPTTIIEYKDFASRYLNVMITNNNFIILVCWFVSFLNIIYSMKDMSSFRNAKAYVFAPSQDNSQPAPSIEEQAAAAVAGARKKYYYCYYYCFYYV